jgi:hypothetical protein
MNESFQHVWISIRNQDGKVVWLDKSDSLGKFRTWLNEGSYQVIFKYLGCVSLDTTVVLRRGVDYTYKVSMAKRDGHYSELLLSKKKMTRKKLKTIRNKKLKDCRCDV